jgi:hypothetical protein
MFGGKVVVDHSQTTSPPFATPDIGPANFPESSCLGHQVARFQLARQFLLKRSVCLVV